MRDIIAKLFHNYQIVSFIYLILAMIIAFIAMLQKHIVFNHRFNFLSELIKCLLILPAVV